MPMTRRLIASLLPALGLTLLAAACAPTPAAPTLVVFFTANSGDLDAPALSAVNQAADLARSTPGRTVIVSGYATSIGAAATNQTLSQLRAQIVADALVARGVDRSRVLVRPRGETQGDPGIESRRVEISFAR